MSNKKLILSHLRTLLPVTLLLLVAMVAWGLSSVLTPLAHATDIIPANSSNVAQSTTDTTAPSDVSNVKAVADNASVKLSWDVATDNVGVKGYNIYYGTKGLKNDGDTYEHGPVDAGNKNSYTVTGLTNGTKYYFAVTAYDAAGNESANYSYEVSATPAHASATDTTGPKVVSAQAATYNSVRVVFNEAVSLPGTKPENSFTIKNDATQSALEVKAASLDPNDSEGKTVMLSTGIQKAGATYVLTAQITIKDLAGNPVVSGTSDTAVFTGSDLNPNAMINTQQAQTQSPAAASAGPTITDVKALDATHVQITFSKSVKIGKTPADQFVMTEEQNTENVLNVSKAEISVNGKVVTLTTDPQKNMGYNLIVLDLKGTDGSAVDPNNNATTFNGVGAASQVGADNGTQAAVDTQSMTQQTQDITPPEDATNFMAALLGKVGVHLTWTGSINSAKDLKNYMLYIHKDGDAYDKGKLVDMKKSAFDVKSLVPGATYFFKLTAKDKVGNESQGIETQFTLPETGPELIFLFAGSLGAGKFFSGKKKNKK